MSSFDVVLSPTCEEAIKSHGQLDLYSMDFVVIYVKVAGSIVPMCVLESDPIGALKLRIQACKGFVVKTQKLVFRGRELSRKHSLVKEYNITSGNILHLVLRLSDLLLISVRTTFGEQFEFHVYRHRNVAYLKRRIVEKGNGFVDVKDQEVFYNGEKLKDHLLIDDFCKINDVVVHLVVQRSAKVLSKPAVLSNDEILVSYKCPSKEFSLEPIISNSLVKLPQLLWDMIDSVYEGLERGKRPILSSEGTGGSYFMQEGSGEKYVAIFKPTDEEPLAANNPQGLPLSSNGEGLKRGTRVGEGAMREVAAFILDHPKKGPRSLSSAEIGFAGVSPTVMVRCLNGGFNHPGVFDCSSENNFKVGSLQMFVKNHGSCEDMGPKDFPIEEVHKIGVFDIRMANADRHSGNILMRKDKETGRIVLIPIDHGYCLPENFEDCTFDWLYWPQAREPFSQETIHYIKSLNVEQDMAILKFYGINLSPNCARTFRISTMLLKKGADRKLSPFALGNIMCRETLNKKSVIEEIIHDAQDSMLPEMSEAAFFEAASGIMDTTLDKLVKK